MKNVDKITGNDERNPRWRGVGIRARSKKKYNKKMVFINPARG